MQNKTKIKPNHRGGSRWQTLMLLDADALLLCRFKESSTPSSLPFLLLPLVIIIRWQPSVVAALVSLSRKIHTGPQR